MQVQQALGNRLIYSKVKVKTLRRVKRTPTLTLPILVQMLANLQLYFALKCLTNLSLPKLAQLPQA